MTGKPIHRFQAGAYGPADRSFTEQYLDSCGLFKDAVSILATIAKQERVRLSERTVAGLQRARQQGRIGGRPRIVCDREKVAELRRSGVSLGQISADGPFQNKGRKDYSMKSKSKVAEQKPVVQTVKLEKPLFVRLKPFSATTRRTNQDILRTALIGYLRKMKA